MRLLNNTEYDNNFLYETAKIAICFDSIDKLLEIVVLFYRKRWIENLIMYSIKEEKYEVCETLIKELMRRPGVTPSGFLTHLLYECNNIKGEWFDRIVNLLVKNGADINTMLVKRKLNLVECCHGSHQVKVLLELGGDPNIKGTYRLGSLGLALISYHKDSFRFLLRYGAAVDMDFIHRHQDEEWYSKFVTSTTISVALCSTKWVPRLVKHSKLCLLPMDIIRTLCTTI
jgi:hypothetical protein